MRDRLSEHRTAQPAVPAAGRPAAGRGGLVLGQRAECDVAGVPRAGEQGHAGAVEARLRGEPHQRGRNIADGPLPPRADSRAPATATASSATRPAEKAGSAVETQRQAETESGCTRTPSLSRARRTRGCSA